ncbi:universal stress protein [Paraburkholderia phenazinium]|jgi:nucleotide-binding universal stress UspA family protein|uniref:Universal stress protein n=1 Tax=Paraburkholderia phenazinium TaxID=60549 RepID=A0A1G7SEU1_9BURK|nr:universal stress protein [Paraburkholderia phenazinium]SDG21587.1 Nucleotide-binding universal stress protein, UspA family [Paraburkholderia phenazinium]
MYKHILVAMDGSETSARAFDAALTLARDTGAELQPLYVVDNPLMVYDSIGYDPSILRNAFFEEGSRITAEAQSTMTRHAVRGAPRIIEVEPVGNGIAHSILAAAADLKADLVVLGTHGRRGFQRLFLGSVAERFVRMATCPVLLIPAEHAPSAHAQATRGV